MTVPETSGTGETVEQPQTAPGTVETGGQVLLGDLFVTTLREARLRDDTPGSGKTDHDRRTRARVRVPHPHTTSQYIATGVVLIAIALGIGGALYASASVPYTASCLFRVALPLTAETGSDYFAASQYIAQTEVSLAAQSGAYAEATATPGVDPAAILRARVVTPTGFLDYTSVTVSSDHPATIVASANALCAAFVRSISSARTAMRSQETADLEQKIASFTALAQGFLGNRAPTPSELATLQGLQTGIRMASNVLTGLLSTPPDVVAVTATATSGFRVDHRNLAADLFVAGACGLLVTFLVVLVTEAVLKPYLWSPPSTTPQRAPPT